LIESRIWHTLSAGPARRAERKRAGGNCIGAMRARRIAQVNSLSRIILALFSAILLGGIVSLLRFSWRSFAPASAGRPPAPRGPVPLFRDPSCGTFVSPEISIRSTQAGQTHHFCSEQCRDRYLQAERQASRA
jgi:YHS domain-containing protein